MKPRLSRQDKETLDQFTNSFREIEKQVTSTTSSATAGCKVLPAPLAVPEPPGSMQGLNQGQMG